MFGRDPHNSGWAPDAAGPTNAAKVVWRFDGGTPTMNCSPALVDGTIYTGATGDPGGLHAVDATIGEPEWSVETGPRNHNAWISSTPAVVDGVVYAATMAGQVLAVDADTGSPRWKRTFRPRFHDSSPTIVNGTVFLGGDEIPMVLALDASTGTEQWRFTDLRDSAETVESSPAVAEGLVVVASDADRLYALDATTGDVRWRRAIPTFENSAAISGDTVYFAGPYDAAGVNNRLWALSLATGETRWTYDIEDQQVESSPAVADGRVYVPAWERRVCWGGDDGTPECAGQTRGRLHALDAATGDRAWVTELRTDIRSSPAVADGAVYVSAKGGVSAVSTDGTPLWRVPFGLVSSAEDPYVASSPAVGDGRVYIGCSDGHLYAVGNPTA